MNYEEFIAKALKGRSVNSVAKALHIPQRTLDRCSKGEAFPDFSVARLLAMEAGLPKEEVFDLIANEEEKRKRKFSYNTDRADVAQLVEQLIRNQ